MCVCLRARVCAYACSRRNACLCKHIYIHCIRTDRSRSFQLRICRRWTCWDPVTRLSSSSGPANRIRSESCSSVNPCMRTYMHTSMRTLREFACACMHACMNTHTNTHTHRFVTEIKKQTFSPYWNQTFTFHFESIFFREMYTLTQHASHPQEVPVCGRACVHACGCTCSYSDEAQTHT